MVRECTVHLRHPGIRSVQHIAKTVRDSLVPVPALRPRLPAWPNLYMSMVE